MHLMMFKNTFFPIIIGIVLTAISCGSGTKAEEVGSVKLEVGNKTGEVTNLSTQDKQIPVVAANQTDAYLKLLRGKKVGIVANQSSVIFKDGRLKTDDHKFTHLVDSLVSLKIDVKKVYALEHGFRGTADAGELIKDGKDPKTGIPIISLYGNNKKPKPEQLNGIDVMVFDLQDVGVRFYTYISSLHYVMEACAEANIPLILLDRPNPNGAYVDGPILEKEHTSFVGMHPIPVVHGMTIGEYAQMINGEKWLKNAVQCELIVIPVKNYTRQTSYSLPIKPSPNLPNDTSINLYPSLCFFEGTNVSVGRGTNKQFQIFGSPYLSEEDNTFQFTPRPNEGAKNPPYQGKLCFGKDLSDLKPIHKIELKWLIEAYNQTTDKNVFFTDFFTKLAGTKKLRQQIEQGMSEAEIKTTWQKGLEDFKTLRSNYLVYD
ncbi:MAG: exo-beta-N-acetylmuramidase NamZ family protein [Aquaticitalea sp.]